MTPTQLFKQKPWGSWQSFPLAALPSASKPGPAPSALPHHITNAAASPSGTCSLLLAPLDDSNSLLPAPHPPPPHLSSKPASARCQEASFLTNPSTRSLNTQGSFPSWSLCSSPVVSSVHQLPRLVPSHHPSLRLNRHLEGPFPIHLKKRVPLFSGRLDSFCFFRGTRHVSPSCFYSPVYLFVSVSPDQKPQAAGRDCLPPMFAELACQVLC